MTQNFFGRLYRDHPVYLNKENFRYIMLGRLTQDALENLFSMIRSHCSVPDARDFKCALRMVCLSQFKGKINNTSYAHADTDHLVKYCDSLNSSVSNEDQEDQTDDNNHLEISGFSYDESLISDHVKEALYNFLGSLLHKIKKNKKHVMSVTTRSLSKTMKNIWGSVLSPD
jgi:hypothetical protein